MATAVTTAPTGPATTASRLAAVPILAECGPAELMRIERLVTVVSVPAGRRLMTEGGYGHDFVILLSGAASVSAAGALVARLGPGDFAGEASLLSDEPRHATVDTTELCDLAVIGHGEFRQFLREAPNATRRLLHAVSGRHASDSAACHPPGH